MKVVVVGAGPAGLAAARAAAHSSSGSSANVTLLDDNPTTGGQIWRGHAQPQTPSIRTLLSTRVISASHSELHLESGTLKFDKLILATGARELFVPFPGWTLPGVFGAGGLQALAKSGLDLRNKRIVVAGTGPLLLAVAHYFRTHGADVLLVAEQAPMNALAHFAAALPFAKWLEAIKLWIPCFSPSTWVVEAHGTTHLESITLMNRRKIKCDYLAIGYGLVPNLELPDLMGVDPCALDEYQRTSDPAIFCAGEVTGIGGVDLANIQGRIAGYAAAGNLDKARALFRKRQSHARFKQALATTFTLRPELKQLPKPDTFVCRCEDVTYSELEQKTSWREAKIHARCGMGPCQGRVCGPATEFLFGWRPDSTRPPIFPARVECLGNIDSIHE